MALTRVKGSVKVDRPFLTVDKMINARGILVGDECRTKEFSTGNGGGGIYDAVLTSSVTPNGYNIIQSIAEPLISFVLRIGVYDVDQFGAVSGGVTDASAAINACFLAGAGKRIRFGEGKTYRANSTLLIHGHGTKIDGNNATINSYATQAAVDFNLVSGNYHVNIGVRDLSINAYGVGAYALPIKASYSTFERVSIGLPSINVAGRGLNLVGDALGTGPYYNTFINCDVQSTSAGTDHKGIVLQPDAGGRAPNANTFIGGRVGQCLVNYEISGNGNNFYSPSSEGVGTSGTSFLFQGTTPTNCQQNFIFSPYLESVYTGFAFNANASNNGVYGGFYTGISSFWTDSGTSNFSLTDLRQWKANTGIEFGSLSSDVNVLDYYGEGTWTPTPTGITVNSGTPVWSGSYTRVGNTVTAKFLCSGGNITTVAGVSTITLPFTSSSVTSWGGFGDQGSTIGGGQVASYGGDLYFASALTASTLSGSITFQV